MLPWQQLLPDTPQNPENLLKIHAGVKAVEDPETIRPENLKSVAMATDVLPDTPKT